MNTSIPICRIVNMLILAHMKDYIYLLCFLYICWPLVSRCWWCRKRGRNPLRLQLLPKLQLLRPNRRRKQDLRRNPVPIPVSRFSDLVFFSAEVLHQPEGMPSGASRVMMYSIVTHCIPMHPSICTMHPSVCILCYNALQNCILGMLYTLAIWLCWVFSQMVIKFQS